MKRRIVALAGACAILAAAAASGGEARTEAPNPAFVGLASPHLSNPILGALNLGQQRAAKALGWRTRTLDDNLSPDKQVANIDTFVSLKVNAVTAWSLNPGAVDAAYQRARRAGIAIVGFNSVSRFINTNVRTELSGSCAPFRREAAYIAQRIPRAKVLVIGGPPVPSLAMRVRCFEAAAKARGLTILDKQDNVSDVAAPAQRIAADMLTKHPDTQAIWAYNDPTALGAAAAVRSTGKTIWAGSRKGLIVVGNNADRNAIAAIKARALTMTYDENTFEAGVAAIRALRPVLRDGRPLSAMPRQVLIKATMYDLSNVGRWLPPGRRAVKLR